MVADEGRSMIPVHLGESPSYSNEEILAQHGQRACKEIEIVQRRLLAPVLFGGCWASNNDSGRGN